MRFGAQGQFTMHRGQRQYFHPRWGGMRNKLKVLQKICLGHFLKTPRGIQSKKKIQSIRTGSGTVGKSPEGVFIMNNFKVALSQKTAADFPSSLFILFNSAF